MTSTTIHASGGRGRSTGNTSRFSDRTQVALDLAKPRLTLLVVVTTGVGYLLAHQGIFWDLGRLAGTLFGTTLVAAGASALNQWWEARWDQQMVRTQGRPLPTGRISARGVLAYSLIATSGGVLVLVASATWLATGLALTTLAFYVLLYTPLKRVSTLNTLVGAIPGAIPPLIGWSAVRGTLDPPAWILFAILFVWQVPHFLAIAWLYRSDYSQGGFRMLSVDDPTGGSSGRMAALYAAALIPVSLTSVLVGLGGWVYLVGSVVAGMSFLIASILFQRNPSTQTARGLFLVSLLYLPCVLALLIFDTQPLIRQAW